MGRLARQPQRTPSQLPSHPGPHLALARSILGRSCPPCPCCIGSRNASHHRDQGSAPAGFRVGWLRGAAVGGGGVLLLWLPAGAAGDHEAGARPGSAPCCGAGLHQGTLHQGGLHSGAPGRSQGTVLATSRRAPGHWECRVRRHWRMHWQRRAHDTPQQAADCMGTPTCTLAPALRFRDQRQRIWAAAASPGALCTRNQSPGDSPLAARASPAPQRRPASCRFHRQCSRVLL